MGKPAEALRLLCSDSWSTAKLSSFLQGALGELAWRSSGSRDKTGSSQEAGSHLPLHTSIPVTRGDEAFCSEASFADIPPVKRNMNLRLYSLGSHNDYTVSDHITTWSLDRCALHFPAQVEDLYYHQFTQGVLWPLFHSIPTNFNEALLENFQGQYEVRLLMELELYWISQVNVPGKAKVVLDDVFDAGC